MNDLSPEEYAILENEDDGGNGFYSVQRECPCGAWHFSRDLYWLHRLEHEAAKEAE